MLKMIYLNFIENLTLFSSIILGIFIGSLNPLPVHSNPVPPGDADVNFHRFKWTFLDTSKYPKFEGVNPNATTVMLFFKGDADLKLPDVATFRQQAYATQNCYRRRHGADPLEVSAELEQVSQRWANHLASISQVEHSQSNFGENIFASSTPNIDGRTPIDAWYNEVTEYNFDVDRFQPSAGHFSQLVWKGSKSCGISYAGGDRFTKFTVVVANYDPPGNSGNYKENVSPPVANIDCIDIPTGGVGQGPSGGTNTTQSPPPETGGPSGPPSIPIGPSSPTPSTVTVTSPPISATTIEPSAIPSPTFRPPTTTPGSGDYNCIYTETGDIFCYPPGQPILTPSPGQGHGQGHRPPGNRPPPPGNRPPPPGNRPPPPGNRPPPPGNRPPPPGNRPPPPGNRPPPPGNRPPPLGHLKETYDEFKLLNGE